jgi:hypothetical protein
MFNRTILAIVALAISTAASDAKDKQKKEECHAHDLNVIDKLIREAPSCQRAVAVFENCEFGTSGDVSLGAAVTEKCEADFISKLSAAQKRTYDRKQERCERKYQNRVGTMYRSFEAFCQAYVARDYSTKFYKAAPKRK